MMSALECLRKADYCEHMARSIAQRADRDMLLETAKIWRTLAKATNKPDGVGELAPERPVSD